MKSKFILACLIVSVLGVVGYAITVNPASAVTADSENSAFTIPYRDGNGAFSMGALTATSVSISAQAGPVSLQSRTKAQFDAITPTAAGQMYFCSNCTVPNICTSTGTALSQFVRADDGTKGCGTNE